MKKLYIQHVHLGAKEWGNELMLQIATEILDNETNKDKILVVHVYEHAGWWLQYAKLDGEIIVVGTANDAAVMKGKPELFRQRYVTGADFEYLPEVRRE